MSIQPSKNMVLNGDISFICESQPRWVSCLLVDLSKMHEILANATRDKHRKSKFFLVSLHFAEELESIKIGFGPELDTQLKELLTKFVGVTQDPHSLPPHRGIVDHKIRLTAYSKSQRRYRMCVPKYEELKRQCADFFTQGLVRVSNST